MNISITGRHFEVSEGLKEYIYKKVKKLKYYFYHIINAYIVLEINKLSHIAEVTIVSDEKTFFCEVSKNDMYASIDLLFDKIERQIIRNKEKFKQRKNKNISINFGELERKENDKHSNVITKVKEVTPKPKTEIEALLQLSLNNHRFEIFNNDTKDSFQENIVLKQDNSSVFALIQKESDKWIKREVKLEDSNIVEINKKDYIIHRIELNKAIEKITGNTNKSYIIFYDPEVNTLNILYLRKNKTLALITSGDIV